ncbi:MAG: ATP-binding protein [Prevotellaceae bacterium]|jgi:predicted AAA+ superfamily ATPase|nr:ATP-binding protein [Prevotellaceae bacterium]
MKDNKNYFNRKIDNELEAWKNEENHKPLLMRGARQVGKSSSVRNLGKKFNYFFEVNFEKDDEIRDIFLTAKNLNPKTLCEKISSVKQIPIIPNKTLLFFDEIQACLPAISSLRYFYEDYPELHVIAAGSLLEFALEELHSFGVGRIRSMFMYPFSFYEFMNACGYTMICEAVQKTNLDNPLDEVLHNKTLEILRAFLILGGMPEVVSSYAKGKDMYHCQSVLDDLINSLRADFVKYKQRVPTLQISAAFKAVTEQVGNKFVYSNAQDYSLRQMKDAVELLVMAGLVIPVIHTSASGIPLGAQVNLKKQKMLVLDTGILQRLLGLKLIDILVSKDFDFVNKGNIAELYVGLELLKATSFYEMAQLYYWQRERRNANAEVDYVLQKNYDIIPLEVKSGKQGKMQSLHLFLKEKNLPWGYRTSLENYAEYGKIKVIPLYAVAELIK